MPAGLPALARCSHLHQRPVAPIPRGSSTASPAAPTEGIRSRVWRVGQQDLYGTTYTGGTSGYGTVYQLVPSGGDWTQSVLYSFTNSTDGNGPESGVTIQYVSSGSSTVKALYGTTFWAGSSTGCPLGGFAAGCGTVYSLTPPATSGTLDLQVVVHLQGRGHRWSASFRKPADQWQRPDLRDDLQRRVYVGRLLRSILSGLRHDLPVDAANRSRAAHGPKPSCTTLSAKMEAGPTE